jgi:hypothetical protein
MWIFREPIAFSKGETILYKNGTIYRKSVNSNDPSTWDEVLFDHQGILTMTFFKNSNNFLTIYSFGFTVRNLTVSIPRG